MATVPSFRAGRAHKEYHLLLSLQEINVQTEKLPRFDVAQARKSTLAIIDALEDRFSAAERQEWKTFFDEYPKEVEDVPPE
eukprot:6202645-Pleurochrysis_carterae.AAC.2